jgi:YHS domain-containing protein
MERCSVYNCGVIGVEEYECESSHHLGFKQKYYFCNEHNKVKIINNFLSKQLETEEEGGGSYYVCQKCANSFY